MESFKDVISGFGGAFMCVYIGFPFDIVKTRMQAAKPGVYKGVVDCALKSVKQGGMRGVYKGATPALASALIENSVLFAASPCVCDKMMSVLLDSLCSTTFTSYQGK